MASDYSKNFGRYVFFRYDLHMSSKKPLKKGKSLELEEPLMEDLKEVAAKSGVNSMTLIRECLKAGLTKIREENFSLFRLSDDGSPIAFFVDADHSINVRQVTEWQYTPASSAIEKGEPNSLGDRSPKKVQSPALGKISMSSGSVLRLSGDKAEQFESLWQKMPRRSVAHDSTSATTIQYGVGPDEVADK